MSGEFDQSDREEEFECRVMVVGCPGSGKSSLANKLIGKRDVESSSSEGNLVEEGDQPRAGFMVSKGTDIATQKSQYQTGRVTRNGQTICMKVVDTPSLSGPGEGGPKKAQEEIQRGLSMCCPGGPHVVLFTLSLGSRFYLEHERAFDEVLQLLGEKGVGHLIVVFTHGENLKHRSIEETLAYTKIRGLRKIREKVGTRMVVSSMDPGSRASEMSALMDKIIQVKDSCGSPFVVEDSRTKFLSRGESLALALLTILIVAGVSVFKYNKN
ncbi:hypothetical protein ACOMHN_059889 [Nucella lapillus]